MFKIKMILVRILAVISVLLASFVIMLYGYNYYLYKIDPSSEQPKNGHFKNSDGSASAYTWGYLIRNNNFGFRDDFDIKVPKPLNVKRILVLGDSFTWGAGLDSKQRYTNILTKKLNKNLVSSINKVEVINAAFSGGALVQHRNRLFGTFERINPDIIFYGFVLNDIQHRGQRHSVEGERFYQNVYPITKAIKPFLSNIGLNYIAHNLYNDLYNIALNLLIIPHWVQALDRTYDKKSAEWKNFEIALFQISQLCAIRKLPPPILLVLNHGTYTDKATDYRNPDGILQQWIKWYVQAEEAASKAGFYTSNIQSILAQKYNTKPMAVNIWDGHPNGDLNIFYADEAELLIRNSVKNTWWVNKP
jgi:lysophospholipase L1-like esterase